LKTCLECVNQFSLSIETQNFNLGVMLAGVINDFKVLVWRPTTPHFNLPSKAERQTLRDMLSGVVKIFKMSRCLY
jgi:hypothetical protein